MKSNFLKVLAAFTLSSAGCKQRSGQLDPLAGRYPGQRKVVAVAPGLSMPFRWIPAGFFERCPVDGGDSARSAKVKIGRGFWMAETEVTQHAWATVMKSSHGELDPLVPVDSVSWADCGEFISRLKSPAEGWCFSLPSEDQWEHACRAGSKGPFYGVPEEIAWLDRNSNGKAERVALLKPNAWGLHDMHGNLAEWCADVTGVDGKERAIRGGSWDSDYNAEASSRNSDVPVLRINRVGFRIILRRDRDKQ